MLQPVTNRSTPDNKAMTLDEARAVLWFRNNRRPMGELFDEGYLTQSRLEWAIEKSYDSRIRQAAQLLLEKQRQLSTVSSVEKQPASKLSNLTFTVGMSLEQARSIKWPFRPFQDQPMGALVDTKQLSLKDLAYAVENAWDERVRRAATTLMLVRLEQAVQEPEPSAGFLHVISGGRSYAERRQLFLTLLQGVIIGGLLGASVMYLVWELTSRPPDPSRAVSEMLGSSHANTILISIVVLVMALVVCGGLFLFLLEKVMDRVDKQIANYRKGQEGEDRAVAVMSQSLDGNWHLFRNVVLPGRRRADLDGVLVGSSGTWVMEIKTYTRDHRCIGERWEYRAGNQWRAARTNPSRQAKNNAVHLANFLRSHGIQQWVNPVVVWANPESQLSFENPEVPIWTLDRLPDELGNLWSDKRIAEATKQQIVNNLTKLCQKQEHAE
jgi:hypothetical protein